MEAAGFMREALMDCQVTVITAKVNDNSKDMINVQIFLIQIVRKNPFSSGRGYKHKLTDFGYIL